MELSDPAGLCRGSWAAIHPRLRPKAATGKKKSQLLVLQLSSPLGDLGTFKRSHTEEAGQRPQMLHRFTILPHMMSRSCLGACQVGVSLLLWGILPSWLLRFHPCLAISPALLNVECCTFFPITAVLCWLESRHPYL